MPKLFKGALWVGLTRLITDVSTKINQHPRMVKSIILISLNFAGFFCLWIVVYGLGLLIVPSPEHQDYALMRFGVQFVSFIVALLLSIGLFNLVRGLAIAGKFVSDKISGVNKGLKDGGAVAIEIPKNVIDTTKHFAEGASELARSAGAGVSSGFTKGSEIVKEKAPIVGKAILKAAQTTCGTVRASAEKTALWSQIHIPKVMKDTKAVATSVFKKVGSLFSKEGAE